MLQKRSHYQLRFNNFFLNTFHKVESDFTLPNSSGHYKKHSNFINDIFDNIFPDIVFICEKISYERQLLAGVLHGQY